MARPRTSIKPWWFKNTRSQGQAWHRGHPTYAGRAYCLGRTSRSGHVEIRTDPPPLGDQCVRCLRVLPKAAVIPQPGEVRPLTPQLSLLRSVLQRPRTVVAAATLYGRSPGHTYRDIQLLARLGVRVLARDVAHQRFEGDSGRRQRVYQVAS